jgi:Uma2 family endonuclease
MTAEARRDHLVSLDEWDAMPEDKNLELVNGVLHVVPASLPRHQRAGRRLANWLEEQLPHEWSVETDVDVVLKALPRATVRRPEVIIISSEVWGDGTHRFKADDVLLAVEIISPGSERTDLKIKPGEYAAAGIRHHWIVDLDDPISMAAYVLVDERYEHLGGGSGKIELMSPVPLTFDLDALVRR